MSLFTRMPSRASGTPHNQILDEVLADQEGRLLRRRPLGVGVRAAWPRECPEGSAPEGDRATAEDPVADASSSRSHRPPSSVQYGSGVAGDRSYRLYPTSRRAPSCRPRGGVAERRLFGNGGGQRGSLLWGWCTRRAWQTAPTCQATSTCRSLLDVDHVQHECSERSAPRGRHS